MEQVGDTPDDELECTGETMARRENARMRQINIGKSRQEYRRYFVEVSREQRSSSQPRTPDPRTRASKRQFDRELSSWRRQLHEWDAAAFPQGDSFSASAPPWSGGAGGGAGSEASSSPGKRQVATPSLRQSRGSPSDGQDDSTARQISLADLFPASDASPSSVRLPCQAFGQTPPQHQWQAFSPLNAASPHPVTPATRRHSIFGLQQHSMPEGDETPDYKPQMPQADFNANAFLQDKFATHCNGGYPMLMMAPPPMAIPGMALQPHLQLHVQQAHPMLETFQYVPAAPQQPLQPQQLLLPLPLPLFGGGGDAGCSVAPRQLSPPPKARPRCGEGSPSDPRTPVCTPKAASGDSDDLGDPAWAAASELSGLRSVERRPIGRAAWTHGSPPPSVAKTPNHRFMVPETPSPIPYHYSQHLSTSGLNWPPAFPASLPCEVRPVMQVVHQQHVQLGGLSSWGSMMPVDWSQVPPMCGGMLESVSHARAT